MIFIILLYFCSFLWSMNINRRKNYEEITRARKAIRKDTKNIRSVPKILVSQKDVDDGFKVFFLRFDLNSNS